MFDSQDFVKFLGVLIDKQLTWSQHIDQLTNRLSRIVFLFSRLVHYVPFDYVKSAYFALFQSIASYGLIYYGSSPKIHEVLLSQKKSSE